MANGYLGSKPDVSWWLTQVRQGIKYRKKCASEDMWDAWRAAYRGNWKSGVLPVNLFFKMIRQTVPKIYFRNPKVSIVSTRPGADALARARILERVDNKMIKRMRVKEQMKRMVQDGFLFGTMVGKLGFGAEFTPTPDILETESPLDRKDYKVEYNSTIERNMPWFLRVPTGQFIVPDGCSDIESARWCGHWIRRPLDDVKEDKRFKNVANLRPSAKGRKTELGSVLAPEEADMIDLIEIRDKKSQKVIVLAPYSSERVLFFEEDELQINGGVPFYTASFNPDDEYFWGVPDSRILDPQQRDINETRTLMMKHKRASIVKIIAKRGGISQDEAEKFVDENVSSVVWADDDPEMVIKTMQQGGIPKEFFLQEDRVYNDARENIGFSRNDLGEYQQGSRKPTAAEVNVVASASSIRVDERRDIMADMLVDLVSDMHQIIFEKWNDEQIIDVAGPDGAPVWVRFKGDMLKSGRYEVSVDPDTGVPMTREVRRQLAVDEYSILKDNPLIDPQKLTRYILNEMGGVANDDLMRDGALGSRSNPMDIQQYANQLQQGGGQGGSIRAVS